MQNLVFAENVHSYVKKELLLNMGQLISIG